MKAVQGTIGNTAVLIQTIDQELEIFNPDQENLVLVDTGIGDEMKDVYKNAKAIIRGIAEDFGKELDSTREVAHVKQMEVEFSLGLSVEGKAWILGAKNDYSLKVKLVWQGETK